MPNTYANLGSQIGDILATAAVGSPSIPRGYTAGIDAGSQHNLRRAQQGQALADTEEILYRLGQAKRSDAMTGGDLAQAMGVPSDMVEALSRGADVMQPLPQDEGPTRPTAADVIPQEMIDKYTNAETIRALHTMAGGSGSGATAKTLMDALSGGQDLGLMYGMQGGRQEAKDVAAMKAAMKGEYPGAPGGSSKLPAAKIQEVEYLVSQGTPYSDAVNTVYGGTPAADVQSVEHLMSLGVPQAIAVEAVHGSPRSKRYADVYAKVFAQTFSVTQATRAAESAAESYTQDFSLGGEPSSAAPLNVIKIYE